MTRPLRIELSGGIYHVTSRGNRQDDIYFSDDDRKVWLNLLGQVCQRFNWYIQEKKEVRKKRGSSLSLSHCYAIIFNFSL